MLHENSSTLKGSFNIINWSCGKYWFPELTDLLNNDLFVILLKSITVVDFITHLLRKILKYEAAVRIMVAESSFLKFSFSLESYNFIGKKYHPFFSLR